MMLRSVVVFFFFALAALGACGNRSNRPGDGGDLRPDIVCDEGSTTIVLECPGDVDLGCIPAAGARGGFQVAAASCTDPSPSVVCTPSATDTFAPGDTPVNCTATASTGQMTSCTFVAHAILEGHFALDCPPTATASCSGAATPVALTAPTVDERCGSATDITSDAPPGGFASGETVVTFTGTGAGGITASCTTRVTVVDEAPPALECPPTWVAVRTEPTADVPAPPVDARDLCQGTLAATSTPPTLSRGTVPVVYSAADASGNTSTCRTEVTVLDAFAPSGLRVASARLGADGSTSIAIAWDPSTGADATGYRVERATALDGDWTALGVLGLGELTFTDPALPGTVAWYRVVTVAGTYEGGGTAPVRALSIAPAAYDLRGQSVATVPFLTTLYAAVRHPVDFAFGPYPLVLLLHGNHGNCRPALATRQDECADTQDHDCPWAGYTTAPNAEGLGYLAETLAAHGYVAATLSANALNCRVDYILERTELLLEHLRRWQLWAAMGGDPFGARFAGGVDLGRVGLVGHSRGGEAVAHAADRLRATPIPGVTIGSIWSIAPTDYHSPSPDEVPYAVLVPACDGDVPLSHGVSIYDRSTGPAGPEHSQVFFVGANHNFFNTEWRWDDNLVLRATCSPLDEIGARAQRGMLEATLAAWFDGTLVASAEIEPFLRADGDTPAGIDAWAGSDIDLRWSHSAAERTAIDDFSGAGAPGVNLLGQPNSFTGFSRSLSCSGNGCDASFDDPHDAMLLSWDGGTPLGDWDLGGLDASGAAALSFRVVSRRSTLNAGISEQGFLVRLVDAGGTAVEFPVSDVRRIPHLYPSNAQKEILQTVRVPLAELATRTPGFDRAALARLQLEMTVAGHTRGSVLVTDIELAER